MISRRSVRVKVMQTIYAFELLENANPNLYSKSLQNNIQSVNNLYVYLLFFIREICNEVDNMAKIKAEKLLPTDEDLNYSTKILSNSIVQGLNHNEAYQKELKKSALSGKLDEVIVRHLYQKMIDSEVYQQYILSEKNFDLEEDRKVIDYLLDEIILPDELFQEHIEDLFPNWEDDAGFVLEAVRQLVKKSKDEIKLHTNKPSVKSKVLELASFADSLYQKVIESKEEMMIKIEPFLKNWEVERIAVLDLIIIRMALIEFLDFPTIPTKVTINEYVDIAKDYSTPKSGDFVNGVLDKMMKNMLKNGLILKEGRGLNDK